MILEYLILWWIQFLIFFIGSLFYISFHPLRFFLRSICFTRHFDLNSTVTMTHSLQRWGKKKEIKASIMFFFFWKEYIKKKKLSFILLSYNTSRPQFPLLFLKSRALSSFPQPLLLHFPSEKNRSPSNINQTWYNRM